MNNKINEMDKTPTELLSILRTVESNIIKS